MRRVWLLAFACALCAGDRARGSVDDWLSGSSGGLQPYQNESSARERPRRIELNGLGLLAAAGHSADPPASVRRHFAERFEGARYGNQIGLDAGERSGVAALDYGGAAEREEGKLRYVWSERAAGGGTRYLSVWSPEVLPMEKLAPLGDVPGSELADVPRPPGSRRVLSVREAGQPQQLRIYRAADASAVAMRDFYSGELASRGWSADPQFARVAADRGRSGLRFVRSGRELFLDFTRHGEDVDVLAVVTER